MTLTPSQAAALKAAHEIEQRDYPYGATKYRISLRMRDTDFDVYASPFDADFAHLVKQKYLACHERDAYVTPLGLAALREWEEANK